jgi:hypothetical protein
MEADMKCLDDIDALVRECQDFPYPALIKPLLSLRAQIALDVAEERLRLTSVPAEIGEPE